MKPDVVIIAAVANDLVLGYDGKIEWNISEDMRRFNDMTIGHPVIMGRKTYDSIIERLHKPLPGRTSIVLTSQSGIDTDEVKRASSFAQALDIACLIDNKVFVAGGGRVYREAVPMADRLEITRIHKSYSGDTFFPYIDDEKVWKETSRVDREGYSFLTYLRR